MQTAADRPLPSDKSTPGSKSRTHRSTRATKTLAAPAASNDTPLKLDPTAIVSEKATILGSHPISIGAFAIVHPFATLDSSAGPIDIGEGCIVWELANIGQSTERERADGNSAGIGDSVVGAVAEFKRTILGRHSVVEAQSVIEAGAELQERCVIEVGAQVGACAALGEYTRLGPLTTVATGRTIPAYAVLFHASGEGGERATQGVRTNTALRDNPRMRSLQAQGHEQMLLSLRGLLGGAVGRLGLR